MVDFAKLLARTPEEAAEERRKEQEQYLAQLELLVSERTAMVAAVLASKEALTASELKFASDLERMSQRRDLCGLIGGDLAVLSDRQLQFMRAIHARVVGLADPQDDAEATRSPFAHLARNRRG